MMIRYHIREMQEEDLEEVTALEASCFSRPWRYQDFAAVLTDPHRSYLVAGADAVPGIRDRILGGCMLTDIAGEGEITNVAVLEKYRRDHIASALLQRLFELGRSRYGITAFTLEVRSRNIAARRLYEKHGFVQEGIRPGFYDRPKDDAIILWKRDQTGPDAEKMSQSVRLDKGRIKG